MPFIGIALVFFAIGNYVLFPKLGFPQRLRSFFRC